MNEREMGRPEAEARQAEDTKTLKLVDELDRTRSVLRRYLTSPADAMQAFDTSRNQAAHDDLWSAWFAAWDGLGERRPDVDQLC